MQFWERQMHLLLQLNLSSALSENVTVHRCTVEGLCSIRVMKQHLVYSFESSSASFLLDFRLFQVLLHKDNSRASRAPQPMLV